jgi:hypothetical protein
LHSAAYLVDIITISELPNYINQSFLHEKYVIENLTAKKIAGLIGCSTTTVKAYLNQFGLTKGGKGHAVHKEKLAYGTRLAGHHLVAHKGETQIVATIRKMYESEDLGPVAIAGLLNSMKVPTKRQGKQWDHSVIIAILKRLEIYEQSRNSPREGEK